MLGILGQGQVLSGEEEESGLYALNEVFDSASVLRLNVYTVNRLVFDLVSGKQDYTMGPGGDFDTDRPMRIEEAGCILLGNPTQPLELPMEILDEKDWAGVSIKNLSGSSNFPTAVYVTGDFPLQTLTMWPIPVQNPLQIALYPWLPLTQFDDLTVEFVYPPGYREAAASNLAVFWAPEFGIEAPQSVISRAATSLYNLQTANFSPDKLVQEFARPSGRNLYNVYSDQMGGR